MPFSPVSWMVHRVPGLILFNAINILLCIDEYCDLVVKLRANINEDD
jgi:hypothetical protein